MSFLSHARHLAQLFPRIRKHNAQVLPRAAGLYGVGGTARFARGHWAPLQYFAQNRADHPGSNARAFSLAFELCRPGDDVLLSVPCFALAHDTLVRCGVRLRVVRRNFEESYRLDPYHLADAMTSSTRLISIASPHNPSGICVPQADIQLILAAMSSRCPNAFLFVDVLDGAASYGEAPALASMASLDARVIVGSSLSKAHALPGLRCGWLTVPCVSLFERLTLAKMNMIISGSALDEFLAAALLERGDECSARAPQTLASPQYCLVLACLRKL